MNEKEQIIRKKLSEYQDKHLTLEYASVRHYKLPFYWEVIIAIPECTKYDIELFEKIWWEYNEENKEKIKELLKKIKSEKQYHWDHQVYNNRYGNSTLRDHVSEFIESKSIEKTEKDLEILFKVFGNYADLNYVRRYHREYFFYKRKEEKITVTRFERN